MNLRERLEILGIAAGRVFEPIEAFGEFYNLATRNL